MKVKITIPIPIGRPDRNGIIYTKEAIDNASLNFRKNLPIIYRDDEHEIDGIIIGTTTGSSHIQTYDHENHICNITVDGMIFHGGTECIIKEIKDNKVTSFEITGIGLSK